MARYKLLAPAYINERFYSEQEINAAEPLGGIIVDFSGEVREGIDTHLQLVEDARNKKQAEADAQAAQDADREAAIAAKLTEDGKPSGKPIDDKTPIDVVRAQLALFKQNPAT